MLCQGILLASWQSNVGLGVYYQPPLAPLMHIAEQRFLKLLALLYYGMYMLSSLDVLSF